MGEVEPAFFQDPEHRPSLTAAHAQGIPLIDLSPKRGEGEEDDETVQRRLVAEIGEACRKWGFFQVVNHGVPEEMRERVEREARRWFTEQTPEEKKEVRRDDKRALGYYETEHTKNVRDWKEVFDFAVVDPILVHASLDDDVAIAEWFNQWPLRSPEFRQACEEYTQEVEKLAHKLMGLIALSLGLPADRFEEFFKDQTSTVRLNHYPPCPVPHLALGVGRHKDPGALTILAQDNVGGLQVKRKSDGEWDLVPPTSNALIINVGDIIQVWSNDAYESVEHRVMVNSEKDRISIPFFFNPSHYVTVEPLQELTDNDQNPPKYTPYSWGKFYLTRKRSNFMKLNVENIQIYHFRISNPTSQLQS